MKTRILVVGPGAVGGYFAWKLSWTAHVSLLPKPTSVEILRREGLHIESGGVVHQAIMPVYSKASEIPVEPDWVIVATKMYDFEQVLNDISALDWKKACFVSLQNGIEANDTLRNAFGPARTAQGFCQLGAEKLRPGYILHRALGTVFLGKNDEMMPKDWKALVQPFQDANIELKIPDDFKRALWLKFAWNAVFNLLCARYNVSTDEILRDRFTKKLANTLFDEILAAAKLETVHLTEDDRVGIIDGTKKWGAFVPSTLQDRRKGFPLEIDAFSGAMIRLAHKHSVSFPAFSNLHQELMSLTQIGS
jgi:2-dehydropantoate 2-reductase